jgi:hypothetical protein
MNVLSHKIFSPILLSLVITLSLVATPESTLAQGLDDLICPAVYPCNDDGTVKAPFDQGECGKMFIKQCLSDKAKADIKDCEDLRAFDTSSVKKLKREVSKLKKQLKLIKRSR